MNLTDLQKILQSWLDGGWTMIPLALVAVALYGGALQLLSYLKDRGHQGISDAQLKRWITHPSEASGEVGEVIRYTQDEVKNLDEITNRFVQITAAKIPEVDRRMVFLNVLVAAAPLLGLLGTVLGMLTTFQGIAAGGGKMVDTIAEGISEALITTEMGLLVALPGMMFAYLIRRGRNEYVAFLARLESLTLRHFRAQFHGMTNVFRRDAFSPAPTQPIAEDLVLNQPVAA